MILYTILTFLNPNETLWDKYPVYHPYDQDTPEFIFERTPNWLFDWSLTQDLINVVAAIVVVLIATTCSKWLRKFSLTVCFIIAWFLGFFVYDLGMCTGEAVSLLTNAPMAIVHAFQMFLLESDVSAIHTAYHDNWRFMMCFSFAHAFAAWVSMLFVIKHFGYNIMAKFKLLWFRILSWIVTLPCFNCSSLNKKDLYVFWGVNEASFLLAKDICKNYKYDRNKYSIIFVRTNIDEEEQHETHVGINRLLDFLSLRTSEIDEMRKIKCFTTSTHVNLMKVNTDVDNTSTMNVIGNELKLRSLKHIIKRSEGKLHFLFLSDDEVYNLHAVGILAKDITIRESARKRKDNENIEDDIIFHCHARNNSVHRVIEDYNIKRGLDVRIVDSSKINMDNVKRNSLLLPVEYVKVENDATVSSAFNALVVGFSEVGEESVKFLYEYGAFVKSGCTNDNVVRSDFHINVVDNKMKQLAGSFVANMRGIPTALPFMGDVENKDTLITLHDMDCRSVEFYDQLDRWLDNLNYIVLATEDDELNISLGVRIMQLAIRKGRDPEKMCILVRVHKDEDGHIFEIARHYNLLWKAQNATFNNDYSQSEVHTADVVKFPLYIFGLDRNVYTYGNIINSKLINDAIEYKEIYAQSTNSKYVMPTNSRESAWYEEYAETMRLDKDCIHFDFYPTWAAVASLRRKRTQDIANSTHSTTKLLLAKKAGLKKIDEGKISRRVTTISYSLSDGNDIDKHTERILDVLAQTEHLRWNASHEILGYIYAQDKKDEKKMIHKCITSWQNLNEETKSYDYNVVDLAIGIISKTYPLKFKPSDAQFE